MFVYILLSYRGNTVIFPTAVAVNMMHTQGSTRIRCDKVIDACDSKFGGIC